MNESSIEDNSDQTRRNVLTRFAPERIVQIKDLFNSDATDREVARAIGEDHRIVGELRSALGLPQSTRMNRSLPPELMAQVVERIRAGMTDSQIARETGVSISTVRRERLKQKPSESPKVEHLTPEKRSRIAELILQGETNAAISRLVGVSKMTVARVRTQKKLPESPGKSGIAPEPISRIVELIHAGNSDVAISREVGVSRKAIGRVRRHQDKVLLKESDLTKIAGGHNFYALPGAFWLEVKHMTYVELLVDAPSSVLFLPCVNEPWLAVTTSGSLAMPKGTLRSATTGHNKAIIMPGAPQIDKIESTFIYLGEYAVGELTVAGRGWVVIDHLKTSQKDPPGIAAPNSWIVCHDINGVTDIDCLRLKYVNRIPPPGREEAQDSQISEPDYEKRRNTAIQNISRGANISVPQVVSRLARIDKITRPRSLPHRAIRPTL
jgi:uncharacterized protein YerC